MDSEAYLRKRGWVDVPHMLWAMWSKGEHRNLTIGVALAIQREVDALQLDAVNARVDELEAALRLCQPILKERVEQLTVLRDDFFRLGPPDSLKRCKEKLALNTDAYSAIASALGKEGENGD